MTAALRLRPAREEDVEALVRMESAAVSHPWTAGHYRDSIAGHRCLVAEQGAQVVAVLVFSCRAGEAELLNIVVDPAAQGQGLGRLLMDHLIDVNRGLATSIFLEVRAGNTRAVELYRRSGFTERGRRKHYYPGESGREDALIMEYRYA